LADLKIYGTSNGSTVGNSTSINANFTADADRYRSTPQGGVATNGLVLNVDAANAARGLSFPGVGCSATSWFDLSPSSLNGILNGFSNCGIYGWQGGGNTASPYQITFDGSAAYVSFPWTLLTGNAARSIEVWFNTSSTAGSNIVSWGANAVNQLSQVGIYQGNIGYLGYSNDLSIPAAPYANGTWHQIVTTFDGTNQYLYIDDLQKGYRTTTLNTGSSGLNIGDSILAGNYFLGSVAKVAIYNRALLPSEVVGNCKPRSVTRIYPAAFAEGSFIAFRCL
jgi:hypothetical protein